MDSLKYLFKKPVISGRLARWHQLWQSSTPHMQLQNQKSIKEQAIADHLAKNSVEEYEPMADLFPGETIMSIELEECTPTGACTLAGQIFMAIKPVLLLYPTGAHFPMSMQLKLSCTNNTVEYEVEGGP